MRLSPNSSAVLLMLFFVLINAPQVACDGLTTVDIIALTVSLGLAAFIFAFIAFFLWRAIKQPIVHLNTAERGQEPHVLGGFANTVASEVNPTKVTDETISVPGAVSGIQMTSLAEK